MNVSPTFTLLALFWSPLLRKITDSLASKCSTMFTRPLLTLSFYHLVLDRQWVIRAFLLETASCCCWKWGWWEQWGLSLQTPFTFLIIIWPIANMKILISAALMLLLRDLMVMKIAANLSKSICNCVLTIKGRKARSVYSNIQISHVLTQLLLTLSLNKKASLL